MFHTLLIITLFLLASFLVCLITLRLSINIKHLSFFSFITNINGFFEIPTRPVYFDPPPLPPPLPPFIKFNVKSPTSPFILTPPFIRYLRVGMGECLYLIFPPSEKSFE